MLNQVHVRIGQRLRNDVVLRVKGPVHPRDPELREACHGRVDIIGPQSLSGRHDLRGVVDDDAELLTDYSVVHGDV